MSNTNLLRLENAQNSMRKGYKFRYYRYHNIETGSIAMITYFLRNPQCQHSSVLYSFVLFCTVLCCFVLSCSVLYCLALFCTVLYCFVLFCTVRQTDRGTDIRTCWAASLQLKILEILYLMDKEIFQFEPLGAEKFAFKGFTV